MTDKIFAKIDKKRKSKPYTEYLTGLGNAELFAKNFGNKIRYNYKTGAWLIFSGQYWQPDDSGEVKRLMFQSARSRAKTAIDDVSDPDARFKVIKFAISSESRSKIEAALALSQNLIPIADNGKNWDSGKNLIMLKNGLLNLDTGEIRDGTPEDKISKITNVSFEPEAECPRWLQFVDEVFMGDAELAKFFQKAVGYSMSGYTNEQVLFLCYGSGSNGKSISLTIIRNMLGDYAANAPSSLLQKTYSQNTNDSAAVDGQRFVVSSEVQVTAKLNEERLKALSGGDPITARFLNKEFFTFVPIAKFWLFVNHKPRVDDNSHAFWRRIRPIPFKRTFKPEEQDRNLEKKLEKEFPGILNWAIQGYHLWKKEGLNPPQEVTQATSDYRAENDVLYDFLAENFQENQDIKALEVYKQYTTWAERAGLKQKDVLSQTNFGRLMSDRFSKKRKRDGNYYLDVGSSESECIVDDPFSNTSYKTEDSSSYIKTRENDTHSTPLQGKIYEE